MSVLRFSRRAVRQTSYQVNEGKQERDAQKRQHDQHFQVGKHRQTMPQQVVIAHEEHESAAQKHAKQGAKHDAPIEFGSGFSHP